jgi:hypothetical protein
MNGASILASSDQTVRRRVADIDSCRVNEDLDARGFALIDPILSPRPVSNERTAPSGQ